MTLGGARKGAGRKPGRVHDVTLSVELPRSSLDAARAAALAAGISLAEFVRLAVEKAVDTQRDMK